MKKSLKLLWHALWLCTCCLAFWFCTNVEHSIGYSCSSKATGFPVPISEYLCGCYGGSEGGETHQYPGIMADLARRKEITFIHVRRQNHCNEEVQEMMKKIGFTDQHFIINAKEI